MLVVAILVVILVWFLYRSTKKTEIIRFYKPSCPACVASQKEWDAFNGLVYLNPQNYDCTVTQINTENTAYSDQQLVARYNVTAVPMVVKTTKWLGRTIVYDGPRTKEAYDAFAKQKHW